MHQLPPITSRHGVALVLLAVLVTALLGCATTVTGQPSAADASSSGPAASGSASRPDVSGIAGVVTKNYPAGMHVAPHQRVAYDQSPPFGGAHDVTWAACNGVVYPTAVRNENMVHSLEHGAVWIAYNPDTINDVAREQLAKRVSGQPFMLMSPYPGLDRPISLQAWGHQLTLTDAGDPRIDQFIEALRKNPNTVPEPNGSCVVRSIELFDQDNPPPFDPTPPVPGPNTFPVQ